MTTNMDTRQKQRFVVQIQAGEKVEEIFVLCEKNYAHKRDGNAFLTLTLGDKSGQIKGIVWDNVESIARCANPGDYVLVCAAAGEYRGAIQLVIKSMQMLSAEAILASDYVPASMRNVEQMFERLKALTDKMTSTPLKALMNVFWADSDFVSRFKQAPAAKKMHHAYLGGLLEHSLSMALLAEKVAGHYSGVDRDMLLAGAILHDIGKVRELTCTPAIDYSDEGRLLSHIVIGVEMLSEKIACVEGFPTAQKALLKHMLISHHGVRAFGSPEPPKTIEAVLLNYIDEIDSRVNAIREFMASEDPASAWTSYHRLLERHFYRGENIPLK
jgi:3'-5' exoribonuclease